ncbi:flagellar filament capping protein FliD [Pseudidiomarina donghaiensis]|uniref:flagellar filament capping protein FliD n=1 Tax=Pseudidiomarina donghaiensis TaxID=519452 RepID=UPI003A97DE3C
MASIAALGIGSGLDLNGLLNQLESAERQRLQPITQQKRSYEAKISAYGKLESGLTKFQDAVKKLGEANTFGATTSSVNNDVLSVAASNNTALGSYSVNVTNLARSYSVATQGVADRTASLGTGTGSVSFTLGNGTTHTVDFADGQTSLDDIRDKINSAQTDVQASIVNDGSGTPYRLVFSSTKTGTDAGLTDITYSGALAGNIVTDDATEVTAQNANLTLNGIAISSQTNQVEGAIEGVTLSLAKEGEATISVNRDQESITGAVKEFVESYNELQKTISGLNNFDVETGVSGQLLGDSGLRTVQSQLRNAMSNSVEGAFKTLSDLGIEVELSGQLKLDETKLSSAVSGQLADVQNFFSGTDTVEGFSALTNNTLTNLLAENGPLESRISGFKNSLDRLDDRYIREEERIFNTVERYRKQFAQMDSLIANMNSTSAYLQQQFASLNAQLGQGN